ncbi:MAG: hypothetical protein U0271_40815 [Polyangiaceae bacterium]
MTLGDARFGTRRERMGTWNVDASSEPGILKLRLDGWIGFDEMKAFVAAHNAAIDAYRGRDYKVWCDVSALRPLSPESAELFEKAKRYSATHDNFRGSSVLVADAVVALQHRRTSVDGGVMATELISNDEAQLREHLKKVYRPSEAPPRTHRKPGG